jgi:hypothetical protein
MAEIDATRACGESTVGRTFAMGKRSKVAETAEDVSKMTLAHIDSEIARCLHWSEAGGTSQGRKSFFKRLVWLEAERERLHGTPAPKRRF